jgi:hypothetical protein
VAFAEDRDRRHGDDSDFRDDDWDRDDRDRDGHWERDRDGRGYDWHDDDEPRVIDSQYAGGRRGVLTFELDRRSGRRGDLQLVVSDRSVKIRSVIVTYANGRSHRIRVRGHAMTVDLDLRRRRAIESIEVSYVNRGRERGEIALVTH